MAFYENYVHLCNKIGKSPSAVAIELKLGKPSVTRWKSGTKPRDATILKVAKYFHVTADELVGDVLPGEKEKAPVPAWDDGLALPPGLLYFKKSTASQAL